MLLPLIGPWVQILVLLVVATESAGSLHTTEVLFPTRDLLRSKCAAASSRRRFPALPHAVNLRRFGAPSSSGETSTIVSSPEVIPSPNFAALGFTVLLGAVGRKWYLHRRSYAPRSLSMVALSASAEAVPSPTSLCVLIIGYVWPEPTSSAAGSRMQELLHLFTAQGWRCTFASAAGDSPLMMDLAAMGVERLSIRLNSRSFDDVVRTLQPDVVVFDRFVTEEQYGWRVEAAAPRALRVLDTEDLHCLRHARHAAVRAWRGVWEEDLLDSEMAKREVASILRCDVTLMISEVEMEVLTSVFRVNPALLLYVPFLLPPVSTEVANAPGYHERTGFVSIGNFLHAPNWDQVLVLKSQVWPLIRRCLPDAILRVYGAYPPPKALALSAPKDGFLVLGRAPDAKVAIASARVLLAPLRFGAGLKGKLVEAMQCGTPSVTSSIGAEGILESAPGTSAFTARWYDSPPSAPHPPVVPSASFYEGWPGAVRDTADEFAQAACDLYTDPTLWAEAQVRGPRVLRERFARDRHTQRVVDHLHRVNDDLRAHRLRNFTGAMLRHHSLKSTMYLSKWIELKESGLSSPTTQPTVDSKDACAV